MLKPDREYYLPKDAAEVTQSLVTLISPSDQEWFFQQGGNFVTDRLTRTLQRMGGIPYSAVSLELYKSLDISPRFMLDVVHFIDSDRSHDQTLHLSEFARQPLDDIKQKKLVTEVGNYILAGSFPELKFNHGAREINKGLDISPEYMADFQTMVRLNYGDQGPPKINTQRKRGEIFLGGTIAFVDPMHPK